LVAAAKSTGSGHLLWPKGLSVEDVPAEFVSALNHALTILSWQENLPSDEMPPYWMWSLDWEIEKHFKIVQTRREAKYGDAPPPIEDDDEYEENEFFAEMEREMRG